MSAEQTETVSVPILNCETCGRMAGIIIPVDDVVHCQACEAPIERDRLIAMLELITGRETVRIRCH
jgi:hypothetical protein